MDVCDEIFQMIEVENENFNDKVFNIVLEELEKYTGSIFVFDRSTMPIEKVFITKEHLICLSKNKDVDLLFEILEKYNYNMREEMKNAMFELGHLKKKDKNSNTIKTLLGSPVIQDISFNGKNEFIIWSERYGKFVFELASHYFQNNEKIMNYMENSRLAQMCHHHTLFLSENFPDFYSVTSLCRYYFRGDYHHSYTCDKERNVIIDLCYNSIVDKELYNNMFQTKEISEILNSKVEEEIDLINQKTEQPDRTPILKIALYKEYLKSIGYQGSLENAPTAKVMKK